MLQLHAELFHGSTQFVDLSRLVRDLEKLARDLVNWSMFDRIGDVLHWRTGPFFPSAITKSGKSSSVVIDVEAAMEIRPCITQRSRCNHRLDSSKDS